MKRAFGNIYSSVSEKKHDFKEELSEILIERINSDVKIERIVSKGNITPDNKWYDQDNDEWVIVLKGKGIIEFEDGEKLSMEEGNYLFIPSHHKHRVIFTSVEPPCIWLAVHVSNA